MMKTEDEGFSSASATNQTSKRFRVEKQFDWKQRNELKKKSVLSVNFKLSRLPFIIISSSSSSYFHNLLVTQRSFLQSWSLPIPRWDGQEMRHTMWESVIKLVKRFFSKFLRTLEHWNRPLYFKFLQRFRVNIFFFANFSHPQPTSRNYTHSNSCINFRWQFAGEITRRCLLTRTSSPTNFTNKVNNVRQLSRLSDPPRLSRYT